MRRVALTLMAALLVSTGLVACSKDTTTPETTSGPTTSSLQGEVLVFAAASLTEVFTDLGKQFQEANPGTTITFNFAGSSALATQINAGSPADIFAAASPATMKTVSDAGNAVGTPVVFVRNQLVIAVPKGNPKNITTLAQLTDPAIKVALCAADVPCGAAATKAIASANLTITPATQEEDVKAALSKVVLGEVDAALVYRTDANTDAADVDGIEFPESANAINDYPIALVKGGPNPTVAQAFYDFVLSSTGIDALVAVGFQKP